MCVPVLGWRGVQLTFLSGVRIDLDESIVVQKKSIM